MEPEIKKYPVALPSIESPFLEIDSTLIESVKKAADESPRKRMIFPFHFGTEDVYRRMINVFNPGSYGQPHRHLPKSQSETLVILQGSVACLIFNEVGDITHVAILKAQSDTVGIDIRPGTYHTIVALEPHSVCFEATSGPYDPATNKDFAPWAPKESSPEAEVYYRGLLAKVSS